MDKLTNILMVGLGGAAGSMLRYAVTLLCPVLNISGSIATFSVNILGSFLIGLLTGCCKEGTVFLLMTVGLCGGFTTFSTFSMQNVRMLQDGKIWMAFAYILATVAACIAMAWAGYVLARASGASR